MLNQGSDLLLEIDKRLFEITEVEITRVDSKFLSVRSFRSKDLIKEMKIANSVILSVFMNSNEMCKIDHVP